MIYNLNFTEGCVCYSYLINDVEYVDSTPEVILDVFETLVMDVSDAKTLFSILEDLLYYCPRYGFLAKYKGLTDLWAMYMRSFSDTEEEWDKDKEIIDKYLDTFDGCKTYWLRDCVLYFAETYLDKVDDAAVQQTIIDLVRTNKNTVIKSSDEPCECCGDYITNYKLKIDSGEDYFNTKREKCNC